MLPPGARSRLAAGTRFSDLRWFDRIDSTNRYLLDEARRGAPEGVVAVADHQEAGRGRLGRRWVAPPGSSLLVSVLLRPRLEPERLQLVSAVVALAAADACASVAGVSVELKWPNDLVVGERKLAGVLTETDLSSTPPAVVVGLGLNVAWPTTLPPELAGRAVALNHLTGFEVDRGELLVATLEGLERRYASLASEEGQRQAASEYRQRCGTLGRVVRVELADESFVGTALDLTPEGHLLVALDACLRTVTAGDVVHVR